MATTPRVHPKAAAPPQSRRSFLATAAAGTAGAGVTATLSRGWRALAQSDPAASSRTRWVFLGTDTGPGIFRAAWDERSGGLNTPVLAVACARPTFFALHPTLAVLYSVHEVGGPGAAVSAYGIDSHSGELTLLSQRQTHGDGPCALAVDASGWCVFAANYTGGSLTAFQLGANGSLTETIGIFRYAQETHGPVVDRQDAAHLHSATIAPGNRFLVSCDLGDDVLLVFPFQASAAASIQQPLRFAARAGSGPRHVAFHPNARWMYCIHELDSTIDLYDWPVAGGAASLVRREGSTVSTLAGAAATMGGPAASSAGAAAPTSTACELLLSDDGRFLYTCTRGEDTISVFRIDAVTGLLTPHQRLASGGRTPRFITFDPSRRWLVCCNQTAPGSVSVFAVDRASGRLAATPQSFAADSPMFAQWA